MDFIVEKNTLIVSCQALEDEPLHGSDVMAKMAYAAYLGGASGIRANSSKDIVAIKKVVNLPVIGIVKKEYDNSPIYITPTMVEVKEVVEAGAEVVAVDATSRVRPDGKTLEEFIQEIRRTYPEVKIMADISTFEEGKKANDLGVDVISTTLCGYTEETKNTQIPNLNLIKKLSRSIDKPIICEGGIGTPMQLKSAMKAGAFACVVGSAITRPQLITKRFTEVLGR